MSEIVKRILEVAEPQRIILFGSAATGQITKDSDIDLLVLESATTDREWRPATHRRVRS
jgi:predicted nucleotidyltransferase